MQRESAFSESTHKKLKIYQYWQGRGIKLICISVIIIIFIIILSLALVLALRKSNKAETTDTTITSTMTVTATTTSERFSSRNIGNMTQVRYRHAASVSNNKKVLVAAGYTGQFYLDNAEIYEPSTGSMETVREFYTLSALPDDRILA
ncbi:unnamed protein product [Adineta ricciae]|uniref:Uncharacterized protein n=1 Tax=Adineta ricciae TaxID=249248 RepID=A0A815JGV7_ADIRI|nr:unnamed protein product [Adineta ricciae]CAF1380845.1 unnamed protein product [Adineta ricciae]